jgi:hypothetical protein
MIATAATPAGSPGASGTSLAAHAQSGRKTPPPMANALPCKSCRRFSAAISISPRIAWLNPHSIWGKEKTRGAAIAG